MNAYKKTLAEATRRVTGNINRMKKLHSKRRGDPLLLGKVLDDRVRVCEEFKKK